MKIHNPSTIADPAGTYSHGIEVPPNARWLYIAGQVGMRKDGTVPPTVEEQTEIAWQNIVAILADAGMQVTDLVKITQFLVSLDDFQKYAATRSKFLGIHRPASTGLVVKSLVRANWLVEVEAVAAKAAPAPTAAKKPAAKKRPAAKRKKR
ncbi:MAG TPA: RidA family protein [Burkholderiales bacterium]|nr:RidA family protein [Burkholderiales bacterium]